MKSLALLLLLGLTATLVSSCASTSRLNADGTYSAPPSLNTVDQTARLQNDMREMRH